MAITIGMYIDDNPHAVGHGADVAACAAIDRVLLAGSEQARALARDLDKAEYVGEPDALVSDDSVPLLIALTNNLDAGRLTLAGVEAGKYVYGEKPGARTAAEMERIVAACRETGAHFTPCYARRTFADTLEIRRLIEAGAVGELWSFEANWLTSRAVLRGLEHWLFDAELAGGGIVYWLACHWIDMIRFVTGRRIVAVSGMCRIADERISVEDVACLSVRLEGGAIGTIRCGFVLDPFDGYDDHQLMTAWEGSEGSISHFPHGPVTLRMRTRAAGFGGGSQTREIAIEQKRPGGYAPELLADVVSAVEERRAPMVTEDDALYVLRVAEAAYEASRTGRTQPVG
ncbi:MAG: Gfo/Idh/MocA family protein [Armatimonadota bacterium]|jgi:predicted dehydrogenase